MFGDPLLKRKSNLWAEACNLLSLDEQAYVAKYYAEDGIKTVNDTLVLVTEKQDSCMRKRWTIENFRGQKVVVRDILHKIVHWINKFKEVGDIAMQIDQTHAAIPWAAIRFTLQWSINDLQTFAKVAEGLELVSRIVARYALFESVFLPRHGETPSTAQSKLSAGLLQLYAACMKYLVRIAKYYERSTRERLARSLISSSDSGDDDLETIQQREVEVDQVAKIAQTEVSRQSSDAIHTLKEQNGASFQSLERLVHSLEGPIVRLSGPLTKFEDAISAEERRKALLWLSGVNCRELHKSIISGVIPGTADWIFDRPEYKDWQGSSSSSMLWLRGIPGCGKTKVASKVVQQLLEANSKDLDSAPISYIYCSKTGSKSLTLTPVVILRTIVKHLAFPKSEDRIRQPAWTEYTKKKGAAKMDGLDPWLLTEEECIQLLLSLTQDCPATIVIDGLDEVDGNPRDVLRVLRAVVEDAPNLVKILVSSRDDGAISEELRDITSIRVSSADNSADVKKFVHQRINAAIENRSLLGGKISSSGKDSLIKTLIGNAREMFLLPSLQLKYLCDHRKFKLESDVLATLRYLPPSLMGIFDALYSGIENHEGHARQIAKHVFDWLLAAECPIGASEIITAVSFNQDGTDAIQTLDTDQILDLCCNFVILDHESGQFLFAHASLREYLQQRPEHSVSNSNLTAAKVCLELLLSDACDEDSINTYRGGILEPDQTSKADKKGNFRKYATCYWAQHYARVDEEASESQVGEMMATFITEDQGICFAQWLEDVNELVESRNLEQTVWTKLNSCRSDTASPIFVACVYGILGIMRLDKDSLSKESDFDINQKNSDGATPIYLAARCGHSTLVQFIIEQGAILDVAGGHFGNPLQAAAFQGFEAVTHILMEKRASPCAPGKFPTAIDAALAGGREAVILLLLGYEEVLQSCDINKILEKAARGGHFAVVCDLQQQLKIGALKVQAARGVVIEEHHNALQMALFRSRARIAKAMLRRIPDINESGGPFGNAIQAAAYGGHVAMIDLILCHGGTVHLEGRFGTALRAAALGGHNRAVQHLIDRGAVMTDENGDALEAAAFNGRLSTIKTLFDSGLCDCQKYTFTVSPAVRAACFRGHLQVATYLLTFFGSDAAHHALEAAMDGAQGDIVQLALVHHPQQTDRKSFRTPKGGSCRPVLFSLTQMPPIEASLERTKNKKEQNQQFTCKKKSTSRPRSQTHSTGNEEQQTPGRMRMILGSNIDWEDGRKDLLLIAVQMDLLEVVRELLDQGFNINSRGESHPNDPPQSTPIEEAVILDRVPIIKLLLDRGADAERALQYAVVHQNERVIRIFLQKRPEIEVEVSLSDKSPEIFWPRERSALSLAVEKNSPPIVRIMMDHVRVFYDFKVGSALLTAVGLGSIPMIEMLLSDIELRDLPDDSVHSKEYFAFFESMEEAAQTRNIPALKALLKHVGNHAMYNRMAHDYIKHSISKANWYGVVHCLHIQIEGLSWSTLLETALLSLAEKRDDPWDTEASDPYSRRAQTLDMEREKQAKGRLLKAISCGARESDRLLSSYPVAFQIATGSRNSTMMNFILNDSAPSPGTSGVTPSLRQAALYSACHDGDWDMFDVLVTDGADPFAKAVPPAQRQSIATASISPGPKKPKDVDFFRISLGAFVQAGRYKSLVNWLPILTWFLDSGIELNREEPDLVKSLHLACRWGFLEYVEKLVEKGVSVSALDRTESPWHMFGTPLHAATRAGQKQVAMYLVSCGANVHQQAGDGKSKMRTAIQHALEYVGRWENSRTTLETCEYLVETGASDADCKLLLHAAAKVMNLDFAKRLLLRGICPDRFPTYSSLEMMKLFEEFGFDLISTHNDAPEQQKDALLCGQFPLFQYLVRQQGLQVSFSDWSIMGDLIFLSKDHDGLQYVIRSWNFDPNTVFKREFADCLDPHRKTKEYHFNLLQKACCTWGDIEQAQIVLNAGASIDCPGLSETALEVAVKGTMGNSISERDVALVELLLKHGANVHGLKTGDEPTHNEEPRNLHAPPLLLVLVNDYGKILEMVELLVKHGADVNAGVMPPLRVASQKGHQEVVKFLVQHGAVDYGPNLSFSIDDLINERQTVYGIPIF